MILALFEKRTVSYRILTYVAVFISYDEHHEHVV